MILNWYLTDMAMIFYKTDFQYWLNNGSYQLNFKDIG